MAGDEVGTAGVHSEPGFTFKLDPSRKLLRITKFGQWSLDTVAAYRAARTKAVRDAEAAGIARGTLLMLVDRRDQPVQTQEVLAAVAEAISDNGALARKTAVMVTSVLHMRQIRRTAPTPTMGIFEREDEALAWLLAD